MFDQQLDFVDDNSLAEALVKAMTSIEKAGDRGYELLSASHACDVSGDAPKWTVVLAFRRPGVDG